MPGLNEGMPCAKVGTLRPFLAMLCPHLAMLCPHLAMLRLFPALLCPHLAMLRPFLVMPHPFLVMLCPHVALLRPFLMMLRLFLAMLHAFAVTRREGEEAIHEEAPGHHALRGVLFLVSTTLRQNRGHAAPSRGRGSACVGSSSEREATRPAYVGMPGKPLETPNEARPSRSRVAVEGRRSMSRSKVGVTSTSTRRQDKQRGSRQRK
jgi:hypothetical protein